MVESRERKMGPKEEKKVDSNPFPKIKEEEGRGGRSSLPFDILHHTFSHLHLLDLKKQEEEERRGDWSSLLLELLEQVLPHLHLIDLLAFRATCRQWRLASTSALPYSQPPTPTPWLLFYGALQTPDCFLYNPSAQTSYNIQHVAGSHGGWLLVLGTGGLLFFFNPFSRARIDLPNLPCGCTWIAPVGMSSSSPTSEGTVYVVNRDDSFRVEILVIGWTRYPFPRHEFPLWDILCLRLRPEEGLLFTYCKLAVTFWFDGNEFSFDPLPTLRQTLRRGVWVWDYVGEKEVEWIRLPGMGMEVKHRLSSWMDRCSCSLGCTIVIYTSAGTYLDLVDGGPIWVPNAWGGFFQPRDGVKEVFVQPRFDKPGLSVW